MKVGILFDLDGTLLNTLEDLKDAVNYTLSCYGCPQRSREEIRRFLGNGVRNLLERSLPGKETDPNFEEFLNTYRNYYARHNQDKTAPYPGILQALEQVKARYCVGIVSNKHDSAVVTMCKGYFGDVYARGEREGCPRKPAPDMIYAAMADLGVDRCVYVGDSEVDLAAAKNAGVPCLTVLWGFRDKDLLESEGAKYFCENPQDMPALIEEIIQKESLPLGEGGKNL